MSVQIGDLNSVTADRQAVLFYAWQSDAVGKVNRWFIRDAAERAIKSFSADGSVQDAPRLDSDTQGTAGTPEIVGTIFAKIKAAALFLADVTLVGTIATDKKTPNPNVLMELGYAAGVLGWDRVILVMNRYYGEPEQLPFDLKNRRFPITYKLAPEDEKAEVRQLFVRDVAGAIREALNAEHEAVSRIVSQLTVDSIALLKSHAHGDYFYMASKQEGVEVTNERVSVVIDIVIERLLSLGVVRTLFDSSKDRFGYFWTYNGKLVLRRLGFRK